MSSSGARQGPLPNHSAAFRQREREFPTYAEAIAWVNSLCAVCCGRIKSAGRNRRIAPAQHGALWADT